MNKKVLNILIDFIEWIKIVSNVAKNSGFKTNVDIYENYFAKIELDSKNYIAQIVFWENQNLYVAEILLVASAQTVHLESGMCDINSSFKDFFAVFLDILELEIF